MKWNQMDERELMVMLRARHYAFLAVFFILAGSLLIKAYILGLPLRDYITEITALIVGGIVEVTMDARKGFFDPSMKPSMKSYSLISLAGALIFSAAFAAGRWLQEPMFRMHLWDWLLPASAIMFASLFLIIFAVMAAYGSYVKHRRKKME